MKKMAFISAVMIFLFTSCSTDSDVEIQEIENLETNLTDKVSIPQNRTDGYNQGYFWTVYKDGGRADMTFPHARQYKGNFNLSYRNTRNIVGGKGWRNGANRNIGYNIGSLSGNYEFVGVYGWTRNTDVEYYVVEKGNGGVPNNGYTYVRQYSTDGGTYKFYKKYIRNRPCALKAGNCNFWQYKSVRQNQKGIGRNQNINMNNHARIWKRHGNGFGSYTQYQVFGIEAYSGNYRATGSMNATVW